MGLSLSSAVWLLLGLGVLAGGVAYRMEPVVVRRHVVRPRDLTIEVFGTGTIEAERSATLSPEVVGLLEVVAPAEGADLAAGQLVAKLTTSELEARVRVAEAALGSAETARARRAAEVARTREAIHLAELELERALALRARNALPEADLDRRRSELALAEAAELRALGEQREGEAEVLGATRALEHRRVELDRATLRAPFAGVVTHRIRDPGDVAGPGAPVLRMVDPKSLRVEAWVDEVAIEHLRPGQPARIRLRGQSLLPIAGHMVGVRREVDRETRELLAYVEMDEDRRTWAVGQRADVHIQVGTRRALAVSEELLRVNAEGPRVLVEEEGWIRSRRVQVGLSSGGFREILGGLKEGDVLLEAPAGTPPLREGWRVAPP